MQQLQQVNCKLLGVILNRVETTGRAYKKYYGKYGKYYNSYGYGAYGKEHAEEAVK
jgi:Mrp family chromosome partitioning ATPase